MVCLRTERLFLREFIDDDLIAVHAYSQDKETTKFLDWGPNSLRETTLVLRESIDFQIEQPRTTFDLAVVVQSDNKLIGGCSVAIIDPEGRVAGLGYILNRSAWGHGYATEAAGALMQLAFDTLGIEKVLASCDAENTSSENVLKKLGMVKADHLYRDKFLKGKYRDTVVYAISRSTWLSRAANNSINA